MKRPIAFIHGFKGSRLVSASGRCDWLTGAMALGLRTPNLAMPLRFEEGRQAEDGRTATVPLDKVQVIPGLVEENVYAPFLDALRASGRPWRAFAYDWRRDNAESAARFQSFCQNLQQETGGGPIDVIAHSMGGLVALAALQSGLQGVERVLLAGSPLRGGIGFLEDMHVGTRTGFNRAVLSPQVLATYPSVYSFFPLKGAKLLDETGGPLEIDLFDARSWQDNRLGIFQPRFAPPKGFDAFFAEALRLAAEFRRHFERPLPNAPRFDVLVGRAQQTLASLRRTGSPGAWQWDFASAGTLPGDGRVCAENAVRPEGVPCQVHTSTLAHADLLNDPYLAEFLGDGASGSQNGR